MLTLVLAQGLELYDELYDGCAGLSAGPSQTLPPWEAALTGHCIHVAESW